MKEAQYIWMDGELVPWADAKIHVLTHTLHYGNGVFEGTRAYQTEKGLAVFRLREHTQRLLNSAKIVMIKCPYTLEQLEEAQLLTLRSNKFDSNVYIRPIIYLGYGVMGLYHVHCPVHVSVATWEWGAYLGEEGLENGIRVKTSSFVRNSIKSTMGKAKAVANYLNSQMAKHEAIAAGYEEALLLDDSGFVAEGSGECFFIIRDGKLYTPPFDNSLESITQNTVMHLAKEMGYEVIQRRMTRDEVYIADEAFFTGTAAEVTPVRELDGRIIGNGRRGAITEKLQSAYFDVVHGRSEKHLDWLTFIN